MANALILYDNLLARYSLSITSTVWANYNDVVSNLATPALAQRWVTYGLAAADCRFQFSVAGNPPVVGLVLAHHNLTLAATVRVQASTDVAFGSTIYDSGWLNAYAAGMTDASRDGQLQHFWLLGGGATSAPHWRLEILDAANPAGFIAVGRMLLAGASFSPAVNMLAGASLAYENRTKAEEADSGAEWFVDRQPRKVARFTLGAMTQSEALGHALTLQRLAAGSRRELLFVYDPADGEHSQRRLIFGRLRTLSALEEPFVNRHSSAFEVAEALP